MKSIDGYLSHSEYTWRSAWIGHPIPPRHNYQHSYPWFTFNLRKSSTCELLNFE
jgi:hypothetical protein